MIRKLKIIIFCLLTSTFIYYINQYFIENELNNYKFSSIFFPAQSNKQDFKSTTWHRDMLDSDSSDNYLHHEKLIFNSDSTLTYSTDFLKVDIFFILRKVFWGLKHYERQFEYKKADSENELILIPLNDSALLEGINYEYRLSIKKDSLLFYY